MQPLQTFDHLNTLESDTLPYLDRGAPMIQANYKNFVKHGLVKSAFVPAWKDCVSP